MSKHRDVPLVGRGWRALCSAVPLFLILATMIIVPPVAIAQEAQSTGATGASGATGAVGATGASPTITSDQADYQPGAFVTLTGAGWADGENVHIVVNDTIGQTWKYQSDVVATTGGSFTDSFNLPNYFVSDYDVTASGPVSGTATTTFTDAPLKITGKQHEGQSSTGGYTSGNTNTYKEGDFINFHFTIDSNDATTGTDPSHGFLEVRFTGNDGTCLFFDGSFALGAIDIPSTVGNDSAPAIVGVSGALPTVVPTGPPVPVDFGTSGGEWVQTLEVTFSDFGVAVVNYHLKLSDQAGECNGASQHSRLNPPANAGDFTQTGQQNIPVPANQVIELPEIIVNKLIDRDGNGSFESTAAAGEYKFCLDGAVNCLNTNASGQVTFVNVTPDGAHNITEAQLVFTQGTYVFDSITGTNCVANGTTAVATVASGTTATDASCTFKNKANQGKIELKKAWVGTAGQTTLQIGTSAGGTQVDSQLTGAAGAAPLTTGENPVTAGNYFVSETGGLTNYSSSLACFNDNGAGGGTANDGIKNGTEPVVNPGANNSVAVAANDDIVCTFTNTRNQGKIELIKEWSGTAGQTTLRIGTAQNGTQVDSQLTGAAGAAPLTTGKNNVDTGTYFVSENGGLTNYSSSLACFNDNGAGGGTAHDSIKNGTEPVVGAGLDGSVSVASGDDIVCTFTNTRNQGKIELIKEWSGTAGQTTLRIGTAQNGTQVDSQLTGAAGAAPLTTGKNNVDTGTYFVSENGGLTNYSSSLACFNDNGAGGGTAHDSIKNGTEPVVGAGLDGSVSVASGDDIVCTFTNTRNQGEIKVIKDFSDNSPVGAKVDLQIDGVTELANAEDGDTTGFKTVNTGDHSVGELAVTGTDLADYTTSISCVDDEDTVVASNSNSLSLGSIPVGTGDQITCTITNSRETGEIKVIKDFSDNSPVGAKVDLQIDGVTELANAEDGDTTGFKTVNTGDHSVGELAVTGTDLADYTTSISCVDDEDTVVASNSNSLSLGSIPVGTGDQITCTITNSRETGEIKVIKDFSDNSPVGAKVDLQIDGVTELANAEDGDTTGFKTVNTGDHSVGELAVTGTDLADYTTSISCVDDEDTVVASNSNSLSLGSIPVGTGDQITCTITNSRETGEIKVIKDFSDNSPVGAKVDLQIDGVTELANAEDGDTTGFKTVNTGDHSVGELAVTGTDLADYTTSISCVDDEDTVVASNSNSLSLGSIPVGTGDQITCTITNSRETGEIKVIKDFSDNSPVGAKVDLQIDGVTELANAEDGDTTGFKTVNTGDHSVGELAVTGTDLADYTTSISCVDDEDTVVASNSNSLSLGSIPVGTGDQITCTITNSRETGEIKVIKDFSDNSPVGAKVDLQIDGVTELANAEDGDTTGFKTVNTGDHSVGELAVTGTDLADYTTSISCVDDEDTVVASNSNSLSLGSIPVGTGDQITCTITNSRETGEIKVIKDFSDNSPVGAKVDLQIDGVTELANAEDGDTTGFKTVNTGDHSVGELAVTGTDLADYTTSISCVDDEDTVVASNSNSLSLGSIPVGTGDQITCTITNSRETGEIKVIKDFSDNSPVGAKVDLQIDGVTELANAEDGDTTGFKTVNTGDHSVGELAVTGTDLADYTTSISCVDDEDTVVASNSNSLSLGSIPVGTGDQITCTITNSRETGEIKVIKDFSDNSPVGAKVDLQIDGVTELANAEDGDTTGFKTVNTGDHSVGELAVTGTDLADYTTSISCVDDEDTVVASNSNSLSLGSIPVGTGDQITCTITNSRETGEIKVIKDFSDNSPVGAKVDLQIDGVTELANAEDGDTTGFKTVNTGDHSVGELAVTGTDLADYTTSISCVDDEDTVVASNSNSLSLGSIPVGTGDQITCTITNSRETGEIKVIKDFSDNSPVGAKVDLQIDGVTELANAEDGDTTGFKTVNTGDHSVGELAVTGTDLADYTTSISCVDDEDTVVASNSNSLSLGSIPVGTGDQITCTITNSRETGEIKVIKDFSDNSPVGAKVDLQIDGVTELANAEDGDTTGFKTVNTGDHSVGELAVTGTDLADYTTSISCVDDEDTVVASNSNSLSLGSIPVGTGDQITCTITNSRETGEIKVIKDFSDNSPVGAKVDLQIDGVTELANAEDGDTTGFKTVNTGDHSVGELAVTGTDLADYTTSISCVDDEDTVVASNSNSLSLGSIPVGTGDQITCTITNSRETGEIELIKVWSGTAGQTTLRIGTSQNGTEVDSQLTGAAGAAPLTTGKNTVDTGTYFVSENGGLTNYSSSLACFNDNGAGGGTAHDSIKNGGEPLVSALANGSVSVGTDEDIVCTFTNTRDRGKIELRKVWVGVPGQTTLQIGTAAGDDDVDFQQTGLNGAPPLTTGENAVDTNTYYISEVGGLAGYSISVACFNDIGGGTGGVANDGIKNGSEPIVAVGLNGAVVVGKNADVVCTFTNTKFVHPGTIGFWKNWRNKYNATQMGTIINYIIVHNPLVYATPDLTIAIYDAIFNYGNGTPRDQQILGQLTALKSNLAVSALNPSPPQYNDSICTTGTVNVAGISGATAFFGTATPTIGQVVNKIETTWNGTLDTNRNHWSFNLSTAQKNIAISTLTGINEGTIIVTTC